VTDEQEQKLIADILRSSYHEKPVVRSSPAALAENHHHRADVSPALLPFTPLYTRRQGQNPPAMPVPSPTAPPTSAPLYKPRHLNSSWVRANAGDNTGSSHAHNDSRQSALQPAMHYASAVPFYGRHAHSSLSMEATRPTSMQVAGLGPDQQSLPNFPTQPLLSQAVHPMPGVGVPGLHDGVYGQPPATTNHANLSIRPGMAYQPRSARSQYESGHSGPAMFPSGSRVMPGMDSRWSHSSQVNQDVRHDAPLWHGRGATWTGNGQHRDGAMGHLQPHGLNLRVGMHAVIPSAVRQEDISCAAATRLPRPDDEEQEESAKLIIDSLNHLVL
jgi:hypothetical protein